jgi:hypothetical protein
MDSRTFAAAILFRRRLKSASSSPVYGSSIISIRQFDGADLGLGQVSKGFLAGYLDATRPVIRFKRVDMLVHGEVRSWVF